MDWRNWMDLRRFEWQNGDLQMVSCQGHRSFEAKWWKWKFKRIATELRCCPLLKSTMLGVFGQGYPLYPQFHWALVGGEVYGKCYEVLRQIAMKLRTDSISIDLLFFGKSSDPLGVLLVGVSPCFILFYLFSQKCILLLGAGSVGSETLLFCLVLLKISGARAGTLQRLEVIHSWSLSIRTRTILARTAETRRHASPHVLQMRSVRCQFR